MSEDMPEKMSENMSENLPERMPNHVLIHARKFVRLKCHGGVTRSNVFFSEVVPRPLGDCPVSLSLLLQLGETKVTCKN